jgi:nucleotide-binding universal stress UspA family protein
MITRILVALDGSEHASRAAALAADIGQRYGAALHLVHVVPRLVVTRDLEEFARVEQTDITTACEMAARSVLVPGQTLVTVGGAKVQRTEVLTGDPAEQLLGYARDHDVDLIVLGRRGLGPIRELLIGSTALKVASLAECPVLTVR